MRGEQNVILFPVRIKRANHSFYQGLHPLPALLFSLQKSKQKASTPGSHKIYFYTGILQLPTVGQVKCLYTPLKINFIGGFKGLRKQQRRTTKNTK